VGAIDAAKEIAALVKKAGDVELYKKIVDLQGEVVSLSTRNFELEKKCAEIHAELNLKKSLKHVRLLYYADGDPVPFCPHCQESAGKRIHLFGPIKPRDPTKKVEGWDCPVCYHNFRANPDENFRVSFDHFRARGH
jgi:hypothetical protein